MRSKERGLLRTAQDAVTGVQQDVWGCQSVLTEDAIHAACVTSVHWQIAPTT